MIAAIIGEAWDHCTRKRASFGISYRGGGAGLDIAYLIFCKLIGHRSSYVIPHRQRWIAIQFIAPFGHFGLAVSPKRKGKTFQRITGSHSHADFSLIKVGIILLRIKGRDTQTDFGIIEIGLVITDDKILLFGSDGKGSIETLPTPEKIPFRNPRIEYEPITAAITCPDAESSGGSFFDVHQ